MGIVLGALGVYTVVKYSFLLFILGLMPWQYAGAWSSDVQASGVFTATVAYEHQNTYQVHMSPVSNLRWITTEACELELLFDDVIVEIYEKMDSGLALYSSLRKRIVLKMNLRSAL